MRARRKMSNVYDNWERVVGAVIRREHLWQMFHDRSPTMSSISSDFSFDSQVLDVPFGFSTSSTPVIEVKRKSLKKSYSGRVLETKVKRRDATQWMSYGLLPQNLADRIKSYEKYLLIRNLPKDLSKDIMLHLCLAYLKRVPMFEKMGKQLLLETCERLKFMVYAKDSFIVREGDLVDDMLFITRGTLGIGDYDSLYLKGGDFYGEELFTWALDPHSSSNNCPVSTRTVKALSKVEVFALSADDLKFVASQFRRLHGCRQARSIYRFYSHDWRTWAACFIQAAWLRYYRKKLIREKDYSTLDAFAKGWISPVSLRKPAKVDFTVQVDRFYSPQWAALCIQAAWHRYHMKRTSAALAIQAAWHRYYRTKLVGDQENRSTDALAKGMILLINS